MSRPIITLTTDFGASGPYVAATKGIILGINPAVQLVDVSHEIGAQNIREAALCLSQVVPYFPGGTIHLVVVDPGVGTGRRLLCVQMHGQFFLAPDNGVLSWAARGASSIDRVKLTETRFWRTEVSSTFHGRDVLAPVAAHLSLGVAPREFGPTVAEWVELTWPTPAAGTRRLDGEVLAIDRFGNVISNISRSDLASLTLGTLRVRCGGHEIGSIVRTYADAEVGSVLALIGSSDLVEIALRDGNAGETLGVAVAAPVQVTW